MMTYLRNYNHDRDSGTKQNVKIMFLYIQYKPIYNRFGQSQYDLNQNLKDK